VDDSLLLGYNKKEGGVRINSILYVMLNTFFVLSRFLIGGSDNT
jgi:hypothetical protein